MCNMLTTSTILEIFTESIHELAGQVHDSFDDGSRLFVRSLLPNVQPAQQNDMMQAGVALKATESEICVYPYLFREVCSNGAITAQAIESLVVDRSSQMTHFGIEQEIRSAIQACAAPEVFNDNMDSVRRTVDSDVDLAISLIGLMDHLPANIWEQIYQRFESNEPTQFSLMNAVTSVARDTDDPEFKWRLEELGGGIGAQLLPEIPHQDHGMFIQPLEQVELEW